MIDCATLEPGRDPLSDLDVIEDELAAVRAGRHLGGRPLSERTRIDRPQQGRRARGPRAGRDGQARPRGPRPGGLHRLRRRPHRAARADLRAWPATSPRPAPPSRRPSSRRGSCCGPRPSTTAGFAVTRENTPDGEVFRVVGERPDALGAPDRLLQRRGGRLPRRPARPARASRTRCSRPVRSPATTVVIGSADNAVVFDWEPTLSAGAELLAGPRGSDLRLDDLPARPATRSARTTPTRRAARTAAREDLAAERRAGHWAVAAEPTSRRERPSAAVEAGEADAARPATGGRPVDASVTGRSCLDFVRVHPPPPRAHAARRIVVKVGLVLADHAPTAGSTSTGCAALVDVARRPGAAAAPRWCWSPPARSRPGSAPLGLRPAPARPGHPAGRRQRRPGRCWSPAYSEAFAPARARPSGRCCSPPTTSPAARTTATPSAPSTGCSTSASSRSSTRTTPSPPHEIRFGDNDRLAALVAHLVHADALRAALRRRRAVRRAARRAPGTPPDPAGARPATTSPTSRIGGAGAGVGTGGMATKVEAAGIATAAGIPTVLTSAAQVARRRWPARTSAPSSRPTGSRRATRLLWLAHATDARAAGCCSTTGAVRAVVDRRKSLLPAGITAVEGSFAAGDPVDLCDPTGRAGGPRPGQLRRRRAARRCSGGPPATWPASSGPAYEREVVHRDDLVLL